MRLLAFERTDTTGTVARVRGAAKAVDGWLGKFSLDEVLHKVSHQWRRIFVGLLSVALAVWLSTCFAAVAVDEVGIVQRFGRATTDLKPGLHLRWPWPVESVARVRPGEVRTVEVGFRTIPEDRRSRNSTRPSGGNTWASGHWTALRVDG